MALSLEGQASANEQGKKSRRATAQGRDSPYLLLSTAIEPLEKKNPRRGGEKV
jgi:hypothetical protein